MKKLISRTLILLFLGGAFMAFQGCKRISGQFAIEYITAQASRNQDAKLSLFRLQVSVFSLNQISGKITEWAARIYSDEDELISEITSDNYESLGLNLVASRTPIQPYYSGSLLIITNPAVPGDMFNGKIPATVIVECHILDMNDYESDLKYAGAVAFEEVTE